MKEVEICHNKPEIGCAKLEVYSQPFDLALIRWMSVYPQKKGHGKELLEKIKTYLVDNNLVGLGKDTTSHYKSKKSFFEKFGAKPIPNSSYYYFNENGKSLNELVAALAIIEI